MIIPISGAMNGTSNVFQTIGNLGYQFAAFINGSAGSWGGASIAITITPNNSSIPITIATLTQSNPIIPSYQLATGLFLQYTVTGATVGTSLNLFIAPLGVYGN